MKVKLDEKGIALPDAMVASYAAHMIKTQQNVHTSQMLMVDHLRAELLGKDDIEVEWEFYGLPVKYDKDMRTNDPNSYADPRTNIWEDALRKLL